jgi:hypothetical protein
MTLILIFLGGYISGAVSAVIGILILDRKASVRR